MKNLILLGALLLVCGCDTPYTSNSSTKPTIPASPCELPIPNDTLFQNFWVGMVKGPESEKKIIPFKVDAENYGSLKVVPLFNGDTLEELKFMFEAERGSTTVMMNETIKLLMTKIGNCEQVNLGYSIPSEIKCGRLVMHPFIGFSQLIITDGCRDERYARIKAAKDSLEIEETKNAFN